MLTHRFYLKTIISRNRIENQKIIAMKGRKKVYKTYVDTKTIIVNLLKEDKKNYLPVERLEKLVDFIYQELSKQNKLSEYQISFDINFYSIERTVQYNNDIFELDIDGENVRLKKRESADDLARKYRVDRTIIEIIKKFQNINAA